MDPKRFNPGSTIDDYYLQYARMMEGYSDEGFWHLIHAVYGRYYFEYQDSWEECLSEMFNEDDNGNYRLKPLYDGYQFSFHDGKRVDIEKIAKEYAADRINDNENRSY
jgi:hypothetical protein